VNGHAMLQGSSPMCQEASCRSIAPTAVCGCARGVLPCVQSLRWHSGPHPCVMIACRHGNQDTWRTRCQSACQGLNGQVALHEGHMQVRHDMHAPHVEVPGPTRALGASWPAGNCVGCDSKWQRQQQDSRRHKLIMGNDSQRNEHKKVGCRLTR
jgi:hypothetical protein